MLEAWQILFSSASRLKWHANTLGNSSSVYRKWTLRGDKSRKVQCKRIRDHDRSSTFIPTIRKNSSEPQGKFLRTVAFKNVISQLEPWRSGLAPRSGLGGGRCLFYLTKTILFSDDRPDFHFQHTFTGAVMKLCVVMDKLRLLSKLHNHPSFVRKEKKRIYRQNTIRSATFFVWKRWFLAFWYDSCEVT